MTTLLIAAALPVVIGFVCARWAPRAAQHMSPRAAAGTLTALALTVSLVTGLMLCAAGAVAATELLPVLRPHDWVVGTLRDTLPIPPPMGLGAGAIGAVFLALAFVHVGRLVRSVRRTCLAARGLPCVDGVSIVDDAAMHAFAVPGRHSRIVVSTGLLRALDGSERRAVLEHERAHLRHHHAAYAQLARLAAAANPLMRPVARAVDVTLEQWADADAAQAVGDNATVAHALGRVARPGMRLPVHALGAAQSAVVERVRFLLVPPTRVRGLGALVVVMVIACWICSAVVLLHVHGAVELAEASAGA